MPQFDARFQDQLTDLFRWRRDVRRFRKDPIPQVEVDALLGLAALAPSVGLSEPWRFVKIESAGARTATRAAFERGNADALAGYSGEDANVYARLKLSGMREAPVQIAVFCDDATRKGKGLGAQTMPETRRYSCVCAVMQLWLAARARGLGVGWVSILDPVELRATLRIDPDWSLIAYLCIGLPEEEHLDRELERVGWEKSEGAADRIFTR